MTRGRSHLAQLELRALQHAPLIFFALVFVGFGLTTEGFVSIQNIRNLITQSAATGILAVGMTLLLLTGRVDLSVGAVMYLGGAICGKLLAVGAPLLVGLAGLFATAAVFGAVNYWVSARFRVVSFIVTLATMHMGRGLAQALTETRSIPVPPFESWGSWNLWGWDLPAILFGVVVLVAYVLLQHTGFGRQLYAVGGDAEAARRAGVRVEWIVAAAFVGCSLCAGLAAAVSLTQSPTVSPEFGWEVEFTAIAAAVLGGTSLFGGKGGVLPGAIIGAGLLQMVNNGLNIRNVDPYLYPIILGGIIFLAVLTDSQRNRRIARAERRKIRP
jgi:ribose transport system permease protein